jgi:hypothetical protein
MRGIFLTCHLEFSHVLHLRILNVKDSTDYWFKVKGLGLWYLMPLSTIFQNLYIVVISFIGGGNQSTWRKPLTCCKSLTNFYHIMLYRVHLIWVGFELTTLVEIRTDCTGSCKSNYHKITTTTVPKDNTEYCYKVCICIIVINNILSCCTFWIY